MNDHHRPRLSAGVTVAVVLAAVGLSSQGAAPPPESSANRAPLASAGTAAISGVVLDGSTGQPVSAAIVTIGGDSSTRDHFERERFLTDGRGRFVIRGLRAGDYLLAAEKSGYIPSRFGRSDPRSSVNRPIHLDHGQWFADARIIAWRPSAITGTVTDEVGQPVVGAIVRAYAQMLMAGHQQMAAGPAARTDDRGQYRLEGLGRGRYLVLVPSVQASVPADLTLLPAPPTDPTIAIGPGDRLVVGSYTIPLSQSGPGRAYPPTYFPSVRSVATAAPIDLNFGEERANVDVHIAPERTVRVSGVVEGPPGSTPAGMTVRLLAEGNEGSGYGAETATALVTPRGTFTLLNVPAGRYMIVVSRSTMQYTVSSSLLDVSQSSLEAPAPPGSVGANSGLRMIGTNAGIVGYSIRRDSGSAMYSARRSLTVEAQNLSGVAVPLQRSVTLRGTIVWVKKPRQEFPLSLTAEPANGDVSLGMPTGSIVPGDIATFEIDGLQAGGYTLQLAGGPAGTVRAIEWQGRDFTNRPFDASAGQDIEGIVVTLTTEVVKLTGGVRGERSRPTSTGVVIVFSTNRSLWSGYGLRPSHIASSPVSSGGTFSISSLRAGEYFVVAVDDTLAAAWQDPRFLEAASLVASRVKLGWGETKSVQLAIVAVGVAR